MPIKIPGQTSRATAQLRKENIFVMSEKKGYAPRYSSA